MPPKRHMGEPLGRRCGGGWVVYGMKSGEDRDESEPAKPSPPKPSPAKKVKPVLAPITPTTTVPPTSTVVTAVVVASSSSSNPPPQLVVSLTTTTSASSSCGEEIASAAPSPSPGPASPVVSGKEGGRKKASLSVESGILRKLSTTSGELPPGRSPRSGMNLAVSFNESLVTPSPTHSETPSEAKHFSLGRRESHTKGVSAFKQASSAVMFLRKLGGKVSPRETEKLDLQAAKQKLSAQSPFFSQKFADPKFSSTVKDTLARQFRGYGSLLNESSLKSLRTLGVDTDRLDGYTKFRSIKNSKDLRVEDIRFVSLDDPPIDIHPEEILRQAYEEINFPASRKEQMKAYAIDERAQKSVFISFWFSYCAFFQPRMLLSFSHILKEISMAQVSFWLSEFKNPRHEGSRAFADHSHYFFTRAIYTAYLQSFPGSAILFTKNFENRILLLLGTLFTGIYFTETHYFQFYSKLYPHNLLKGGPPADAPPTAVSSSSSPTTTTTPSSAGASTTSTTATASSTNTSTSAAAGAGAHPSEGESTGVSLECESHYGVGKDGAALGSFLVTMNYAKYDREFNIFNTPILDSKVAQQANKKRIKKKISMAVKYDYQNLNMEDPLITEIISRDSTKAMLSATESSLTPGVVTLPTKNTPTAILQHFLEEKSAATPSHLMGGGRQRAIAHAQTYSMEPLGGPTSARIDIASGSREGGPSTAGTSVTPTATATDDENRPLVSPRLDPRAVQLCVAHRRTENSRMARLATPSTTGTRTPTSPSPDATRARNRIPALLMQGLNRYCSAVMSSGTPRLESQLSWGKLLPKSVANLPAAVAAAGASGNASELTSSAESRDISTPSSDIPHSMAKAMAALDPFANIPRVVESTEDYEPSSPLASAVRWVVDRSSPSSAITNTNTTTTGAGITPPPPHSGGLTGSNSPTRPTTIRATSRQDQALFALSAAKPNRPRPEQIRTSSRDGPLGKPSMSAVVPRPSGAPGVTPETFVNSVMKCKRSVYQMSPLIETVIGKPIEFTMNERFHCNTIADPAEPTSNEKYVLLRLKGQEYERQYREEQKDLQRSHLEDKGKNSLELSLLKTREEHCMTNQDARQLMCNRIMSEFSGSRMGSSQFVNERQKMRNTPLFAGTNLAELTSEVAGSVQRRFREIDKRYAKSRAAERWIAHRMQKTQAVGLTTTRSKKGGSSSSSNDKGGSGLRRGEHEHEVKPIRQLSLLVVP